MGIITKEVEIRINPNNINRYRQLGYDIPIKEASRAMKYKGIDYVADFNKTILVKVEDLPLNSRALIESTCDYCGKSKPITRYSDYNKQTKNGTLKCCCEECATLKHQDVMIEKYGCVATMQVLEIKEKVFKTNNEKYGFNTPAKSPIVQEKIANTLYKNGNAPTSTQQSYIHNLYGGELNYPISHYNADICFYDDKFIVEYDGSGHDISLKYGNITQKEFELKEIRRSCIIKKEGYKQMRIISSKDYLPSEEILLQMLSHAKEYFSNYPEHSWIEYDIDSSIVRNAEQKDGSYFDYGDLRKIKQVV